MLLGHNLCEVCNWLYREELTPCRALQLYMLQLLSPRLDT